jgi:hypothetical protein
MMKRTGGRVQIDISEDEFDCLLMTLGFAFAAAHKKKAGPIDERFILRLTNTINEGNPNYVRYDEANYVRYDEA